MRITSAQLKALVKKLAPANSTATVVDLGNGQLLAADPNLEISVLSPLLQSGDEKKCLSGSVPSRQFSSIVNRLSGEVEVSFSEHAFELKASRGRFSLATIQQPIPALDQSGRSEPVKIPLALFQDLVAYAGGAASEKDRFTYGGLIQLRQAENWLRAAGTDGRRLAVSGAEFAHPEFQFLIPAVAASAVRLLDGETAFLAETNAAVILGSQGKDAAVVICARKLAQKFPDYEKFIPRSFKFEFRFRAEDAKEALRQVEPVVPADEVQRVGFEFGDGLRVHSESEGSIAEDAIPFEQLVPDPMFDPAKFSVALGHAYLSDFFSAVAGDVRLCANSATEPVWLEAGDRKLLLAPVR